MFNTKGALEGVSGGLSHIAKNKTVFESKLPIYPVAQPVSHLWGGKKGQGKGKEVARVRRSKKGVARIMGPKV